MEILYSEIIGRATVREVRVKHKELGEFSLTISICMDELKDCAEVAWDADKNLTPDQWRVTNDWVNTFEWDKKL